MDTAALFIVDVQNDFLPPQGALAVPDGREVVAEIQAILGWEWKVIVASQVRRE
jgi:nicotinamidase-related amidase